MYGLTYSLYYPRDENGFVTFNSENPPKLLSEMLPWSQYKITLPLDCKLSDHQTTL